MYGFQGALGGRVVGASRGCRGVKGPTRDVGHQGAGRGCQGAGRGCSGSGGIGASRGVGGIRGCQGHWGGR